MRKKTKQSGEKAYTHKNTIKFKLLLNMILRVYISPQQQLTIAVGKYILLISYLAAIPNISKRTSPAKVRRTILSLQRSLL